MTHTTNNTVGCTSGSGYPCSIHGWSVCSCSITTGSTLICLVCGVSGAHICNVPTYSYSWCSLCNQSYSTNTIHCCSTYPPLAPWVLPSTTSTGTNISNWTIGSSFKEVKEITTDETLTYEWSGMSFNMKLPSKFSDCFLKVGHSWTPLYPLIFSAFENDSKEVSFHLVIGIIDKALENDKVVLTSVTTTKIEDNLTLMQLCERTKGFFNEDEK